MMDDKQPMRGTTVRHAIFELSYQATHLTRGMDQLHAVAVHPETMCDLLLDETMRPVRMVPGPFSEVPGQPGSVVVLNAPGGPVRVHVCRDVSRLDIAVHHKAQGWSSVAIEQTGPIPGV